MTTAPMLTNAEAAARIGIKPNTLEIWRHKGKGPDFHKLDPDSLRSPIRYRAADIDKWLEARVYTNTSQYPLPSRSPVHATA